MEHRVDDIGECSGSHSPWRPKPEAHLEPWPDCDTMMNDKTNYSGDRQLQRLSRSQAQESSWRRDPEAHPQLPGVEQQPFPRQYTELGEGEDVVKKPRRSCYCSRSTIFILGFVAIVIIAAIVAGGVAGSQAWKT